MPARVDLRRGADVDGAAGGSGSRFRSQRPMGVLLALSESRQKGQKQQERA
jgi:hypothetical protein